MKRNDVWRRMRFSRSRLEAPRKAFTLVELLAALALFLLLATMVIRIFYVSSNVVARAKANSEIYQRARSVMDVIRSDLARTYRGQTGPFFYCGEVAGALPDVPAAAGSDLVSLPAIASVRDGSQIVVFSTTSQEFRLVNPVLAGAGPTPVYQVMYYLRDDGRLMRMVENFEAPETTDAAALLPGEAPGGRSFWMHNDLSTFYPVGNRDTSPEEDFTTNAAAFANSPIYQTCQVVGDSGDGLLSDDALTPDDEVNEYYTLATGVRAIVFRFYDADPDVPGWVTSWNDGGSWADLRAPYAVHVTVDIENTTGAHADSFAELIFLGARP